MMKKLISLVLAFCFILAASVSSFAEIDLGTQITAEDFYDAQNAALDQAKEQSLNQKRISSRATYFSVPVTIYPQIVSYYCGPASAYMVIKSLGYSVAKSEDMLYFFEDCQTSCPYPLVPHTCYKKYKDYQVTLADEMETSYDGTSISDLKDTINDYIENNYYVCHTVANTSAGTTDLVNKVSSTLEDDRPAVCWVEARDLDHYSGSAGQSFGGHFVCISSINVNTLLVGIKDCNYYSGLGGTYTEDADTLRAAMYHSGANNLIW